MSIAPQQLQPEVIHTGDELRAMVIEAQRNGQIVGLVPTMGALHAGHLSLVQVARAECDIVVVTIFVNPTQFEPHEDFDQYPRQLDADLEKLRTLECDVVFAPSTDEMFPAGCDTTVHVGAQPFEGEIRPNHFQGVATVVLKLLMQAPADRAYFGQKDYQQSLVVKQLVRDLNVSTEICVCPIVREDDGLAMSSRNAYLSKEERTQATVLYECLQLAARLVQRDHLETGQCNVAAIQKEIEQLAAARGVTLQYVAFLKEGTAIPVTEVAGPTVVAIAAEIGKTRLIDNIIIG